MTEKPIAIPHELPILPVREIVLFPGGVQPLTVGREGSLALLNSLHGDEKLLGIVAQHDPRVEEPAAADLHTVGTAAKIHKLVKMPNGNVVVFPLEGPAAESALLSLLSLPGRFLPPRSRFSLIWWGHTTPS